MATITDTWDATFQGLPNNARSADYLASDISTPKRAVSERGRREHYWTPGSDNSKHGLHLPGSAIAYVQDAAPTTRPDGDTLDSDDVGRVWYDSDDANIPYLRLTSSWQQIGGGMSGTIYILGSGSADRSIQFAGDASLLWDESEDAFVFDKRISGNYYNSNYESDAPTQNGVFDALDTVIPTTGDSIIVSGAGYDKPGAGTITIGFFSRAYRQSDTVIRLYGLFVDFSGSVYTHYTDCTNGSASGVSVVTYAGTFDNILISW